MKCQAYVNVSPLSDFLTIKLHVLTVTNFALCFHRTKYFTTLPSASKVLSGHPFTLMVEKYLWPRQWGHQDFSVPVSN